MQWSAALIPALLGEEGSRAATEGNLIYGDRLVTDYIMNEELMPGSSG